MLKQLQTEEILRLTRTGIWQVEMEQGGRLSDGFFPGHSQEISQYTKFQIHPSRFHPTMPRPTGQGKYACKEYL